MCGVKVSICAFSSFYHFSASNSWLEPLCTFICVTSVNNVGCSVEPPDYFTETPEEVSYEEPVVMQIFVVFWRVSTLVSIATLQDCSGQLPSCCTGEVFAAWWQPSLSILPHFILLLFLFFFPPPFRWPTCYYQRWLKSECWVSHNLGTHLQPQACTHQLSSPILVVPGPQFAIPSLTPMHPGVVGW